jgi:hypothetical protein
VDFPPWNAIVLFATGGPLTTLFNFDGTSGYNPLGSLTLGSDGLTLFGTTQSGGSGNGTIFALTIPEPSALTLLGMGAFGLMAYIWRRRRR